MLSTLACRTAGQKTLQFVRLFSVTPAQSCNAVTPAEPKKLLPNEEYVASSDILPQTLEQKVQNWKNANDIFYGPDRDFKNFPHPEYKDEPTETYQLCILPTRWFKAMYPRLGVTGSYTLLWGTFIFLLAKEHIIVGVDFLKCIAFMSMVFVITQRSKIGLRIKERIDAGTDEYDKKFYTDPLDKAKSSYLNEIAEIDTEVSRKDAIPAIFEAKQEQLELQLEAEYRQRLKDAHAAVKSRLDYQADVELVQRQFEQQHMVNWIVSNVQNAITPQQEKETIASCIQTLKKMSATAKI